MAVQYGTPAQGGLNRGVAIRDIKLDLGVKHTEANSIAQLMGPKEMYLGLLKQWQNYSIINVPLLAQTELEKNVMYTDGFDSRISYSVTQKFQSPYTIANLNEGEKIGIGNERFPLVLNHGGYTKSDILTYDYTDGKQVVVAFDVDGENPIPYGSGYLYWVKLTDTDPKQYIKRRFVEPGVEWYKVGNVKGEFTTENSTINVESDGLQNLMFQTSQAHQGVEHWITGYADILDYQVGGKSAGSMDVSNAKHFADPHKAVMMYMFETLGSAKDPLNPDRNNPAKAVPNSGRWMPLILSWLYREQAKMQERMLMYSQGGVVDDGRGNKIRLGMGYYPQLKSSSNYSTYSKPEQLMGKLLQATGDLFFGRTDLPLHERRVKWKLGMGAMIEVQKAFNQYYKENIKYTVFADHPNLKGMISGDLMNLKYTTPRFTAINMPECGTIEIEHDPSLDYNAGTKNHHSFIGAYSTKSYRAFIEDLTDASFSNAMAPKGYHSVGEGFDNGGNITLIKPRRYADIYTSYRVGDYCPDVLKTFVGAGQNGHISSMPENGFKMTVQWAGEIWLKDPSRTILIELQDPLHTI